MPNNQEISRSRPMPKSQREEVMPNAIVEGVWRDKVYKKSESGEDTLVETVTDHNLITQPITNLIIALLANDPSMLGGILYHAVGEGDAIWDTTSIPVPTKFDTQLLAELDRRAPDGITYMKYGRGTALSGTTTTIVDPERSDPLECVVGRFEPDGWYNGMQLIITAGTNVGETRTVLSYTRSTGTIVVTTPFPVAIDNTSQYEFVGISWATPTNVLEVRTTWDYGLPTDPINFKYFREQGLFGGTATSIPNSGFMLDRITHSRIAKDPTIKIVRFIDIIVRV